jgi:hypothetical protein
MVCLDEKNGMLFGGRRQSKDRILRQRMLELAGQQPLWMNGYSAGQFDASDNIRADEAFLENAPEDAWCFVENADLTPYLAKIRCVAVYRWNRHYPATEYFPMTYFENKWQLTGTKEFPGSSHDTITEEVYKV